MPYSIYRVNSKADAGEQFAIESYPWGKEYCPKTWGSLTLLSAEGFFLRMYCEEAKPTAQYRENTDPVHMDSCLEAFLDFFPDSDRGYINFECNANGAMKCSIGPGRNSTEHPRLYFEREGIAPPVPNVVRSEHFWGIELMIPLSFLKQAYGRDDFVPGQILKGNFHKCGEQTPIPHFGTFFPVSSPVPDFHRPECFGQLILV